ncbi:MAG TPA: hypothetical protein VHW64_03955 [Nocardioides sp.]|jgi:hypothetical protein|uniref:hypothetical protein n=1 Tax=Nocardioides sp. TaxID=35761 RepID=UPI002E3756E5|nr:hypothetical protein [Nocardioides sp.]HEX3929830.1 hypothetical protein [Nocardioides sp.]
MAQRRDGFRWGRLVTVVVALLVINVPLAVHEWELHRAVTDGVLVTATVTGVRQDGGDFDVSFRLPKSVDADRTGHTVKVEQSVGEEAARTKQLPVRVLKGSPQVFHVDGQVRSWTPLLVTLVADALIGLMLLLTWRRGRLVRRPTLVGIALEDVRAGDDGSLLDRQEDDTYVVNGEVTSTGPTTLVVALRDRDVEIQLRDHTNPVAVGERARVRTHLVG